MNRIKRYAAAAVGLALLLGCGSPAPEPASAEAVERAVIEAELQLKAAEGSSEGDTVRAAEQAQGQGETT